MKPWNTTARQPARFSYDEAPWFDQPDALEVLDRRHREGIYDDSRRAAFQQWIEKGYFVIDGLVDVALIDEMLADLDSVWTADKPTDGLTISGIGLDPVHPSESPHELLVACGAPERARLRAENRWRIHGFYGHSRAAATIFHAEPLRELCSALFGRASSTRYSINFEYGSEQAIHQDMAVFSISPPNHLVGLWLACEDVGPEAGPLVFYPGSHRERMWEGFPDYPRDFLRTSSPETDTAYYAYLSEVAKRYERRTFLAKKGQILVWHGMLIHGGEPAIDRAATRKSFVLHSIADGADRLGELDVEHNW